MTRTAKAVFTTSDGTGPQGTVTFGQNSISEKTYVQVDLKNLDGTSENYHVHMLPLSDDEAECSETGGHFNPTSAPYPCVDMEDAQVNGTACEYGDLSGKHGSLLNHKAVITSYWDSFVPLFGVNSIIGRSVVIHDAGNNRIACANIDFIGTTYKSVAMFSTASQADLTGFITFTQIEENGVMGETSVFAELVDSNDVTSVGHKWHVHQYEVNASGALNGCSSTDTGGHYDPYGVLSNANYATDCAANQMKCEVGDLYNKGGALSIGTNLFYTDINLPVTKTVGSMPGIGARSVVVHDANLAAGRYRCATIHFLGKFSPRKAVATFDVANVATGTMTFTQTNSNSPTLVQLDLKELNAAGGYHVHQFPVTDGCGASSTGGHYNPTGASGTCNSSAVARSNNNCEIGDLSGKHGSLSIGSVVATSYWDQYLPLFGDESILGRSIVIHNTNGARVACADINFMGVTLNSRATFVDPQPVTGSITLTQIEGSTETQVFVNLKKNDNSDTADHKWHVHENALPVAAATAADACSADSVGGHYDPYSVLANNPTNYAADCDENQFACEVGDLVNKNMKISFTGGGFAKQMYTDLQLPVENSETDKPGIGGRSILLHDAASAGTRFTCATVVHTPNSASSSLENWEIGLIAAGVAVAIIVVVVFVVMRQRKLSA